MKRKTWVITLTVALSAIVGLTCFRNLPVWAGDGASATASLVDKDLEVALKNHFEKRFFNQIDASDEQRDKISKLIDGRLDETRPLREQVRQGVVELSQMLASDTDDEQIVKKAHELRATHEKLMDMRLETALKVRAIMTPEQRKTVADKIVGFITGNSKRRLLHG